MLTPFTAVYFAVIVSVAYFANFVSGRWPKNEENWAILTADANFPGFSSWDEAEKYADERKWTVYNIVRLEDKK
jgi:hypothetical protein